MKTEKVYLDNKVVWTDTITLDQRTGNYPIEINQFSQELFTKRALKFIEENRSDPFFLYFLLSFHTITEKYRRKKRYSDIPSFEP